MATFGGGSGSGGPGHWRNGGGGGSNYGPSGDGHVSHPHSSPRDREGVSPLQQHSQHKKDRESKSSSKTHETVVNMLSMLTLGVDDHSPEQNPHPSQAEYGLMSSSTTSISSSNADRMLLLSMANTPESCLTLRRAGCIPLLVEIIHPPRGSDGTKEIIQVRAATALKNIVQFNPDEKEKKKELRVLRLLEGIRLFTEAVKGLLKSKKKQRDAEDGDRISDELRASSENIQHPTTSLGAIMKLSYDEQHRHTMCLLGAIHCLSDLLVSDHLIHGNDSSSVKDDCFNLRRLTGMTLTNLTVYDKTNKALLCGMKDFLNVLVSQLDCENEEICKISASVLRNLSCRVDSVSMAALSEASPCSKLMLAAMKAQKEANLKANLGAVWNLSAQSTKNMIDISMASDEALPFLISLMKLNNPIMKEMKNPMTIVEHASGILRNISQHLRVVPDLKKVLRDNHCYEILLEHLKSSSMLVVGNACGALCSFSGGPDCEEDQRRLLDLNAIPMLKSLVYSKDQRISQGSSTALRNLLSSKFAKDYTPKDYTPNLDSRLYSSSSSGVGSGLSSNYVSIQQQHHHKSSNSESDHEIENFVGRPLSSASGSGSARGMNNQHRIVQAVPPVAHQQSTSSAASVFQQQRSCSTGGQNSAPVQYHSPLSLPLSQPGSAGGGYRDRPTTINYYSSDVEPLDLTITSAKSSPIHVISTRAAEFAGMSSHLPHHNHRVQDQDANNFHNRPQSSQSEHHRQAQRLYNTNPSFVYHHHDQQQQRRDPSWQIEYPGANFNRSCPEILSRFQNKTHDSKPLDYSASGSGSSSLRGGGGGEASASENLLNDSTGGGGDTTFNYSLRFAEDDGDDEGNHHAGSNNKSDDTVKTYCYEGTPQFSKSNSCQDLLQELEFERDEASASNTAPNNNALDSPTNCFTKSSIAANHKLQPIDEVKPYYVENTPAAFSRASSLSSIHSLDEATNGEINADFAESSELHQQQGSFTSADKHEHQPHQARPDNQSALQAPPHPVPRKRSSLPHTPCRVTFSADETPLQFSRCSSVASLESDVCGMQPGGEGGIGNSRNDDDLSDYSRRASEVVSPSELPDSPTRSLAPPTRFLDNNTPAAGPPPTAARRQQHQQQQNSEEDVVKVYSVSVAEKSGFNSCRSLSPLTVDGDEVALLYLPIIGKEKLDSMGKLDLNSPAVTCTNNDSNGIPLLPATTENETVENGADKNKRRGFPNDELKVFAVEGTPFYGVSTATSLSDLLADIDDAEMDDIDRGCKTDNFSNQESEYLVAQAVGQQEQEATNVQNAALAVVNEVHSQNREPGTEDEPIYSDAQLLEKCIRVGKALGIPKGIPKSQSEFRINSNNHQPNPLATTSEAKMTSKSQDFEFDDPDLAALIQIGRNRTTDKDKTPKTKNGKRAEKSNKSQTNSVSATQIVAVKAEPEQQQKATPPGGSEEAHPTLNKVNSDDRKSSTDECISENSPSTNNNDASSNSSPIKPTLLDPNQISTMSLGSEWNDDTPTFSSPIPSMSISTAFKLAESLSMDNSRPPLPPKNQIHRVEKQNMNESINVSCLSVSVLLDNVEPPSTFSLVSSTDCCPGGGRSPQLAPRSQGSTLSDKINKKWKALTDAANNSSHSNLAGQKPPILDSMENSMISISSIKSEIYEASGSESIHNDVFESAIEDCKPSGGGDNSLGLNTYTIFPPENANRLSGVKSTDLSDHNTVISEDFTDAEDIEEYETAPMDDQSLSHNSEGIHVGTKPEKADDEKVISSNNIQNSTVASNQLNSTTKASISVSPSSQATTTSKPLMEVHPLIGSSNKYNTFVVKKSMSPKQKRRDDPDRYRTHTINPINMGGKSFNYDANGNPSLKFATFKVGGPKVVKPLPDLQNLNMDSDSTNSPASTPGHSPKGIRGRRRPLYSSLPPSAIVRKEKQKSAAPPVPPKPTRISSPARSTTSSVAGGVYVRPTRTTELRNAANNSRDNSPPSRRTEAATPSSRNSSNSSLNLINSSSQCRPKVAPKPPQRTTPSITVGSKDFSRSGPSSNVPIQIKASNSSFGLGQQTKQDFNDCSTANMKGYSTLPKSSKLLTPAPFSIDRYSLGGESKESIPGSEKSSRSGITNLWKKMQFRSKDSQISSITHTDGHKLQSEKDSKKSTAVSTKLQNFFGRGKKEKPSNGTSTASGTTAKSQGMPNKANQPFRDPLSVHPDPACNIIFADTAPASTGGGRVRSREGGNKVIVPPFNYTPPDRSNATKGGISESVVNPKPAPRISSKITTV